MEDPIDHGLPFVLDDLWRGSSHNQLCRDDSGIFRVVDANLPPLESIMDSGRRHFDLNLDIPELTHQNSSSITRESVKVEQLPEDVGPEEEQTQHSLPDIWKIDRDLDNWSKTPKLQTWETFTRTEVPETIEKICLSESGPSAFDAIVNSIKSNNNVGVLPQDFVLHSLRNLALGRSSSLFQWSSSKSRFECTLDEFSASGLSKVCCDSLIADMISVGSSIVALRELAEQSHPLRRRCASYSALQSCYSTILDAIDQCLAAELSNIRSIVQLQRLLQVPRRLLDLLQSLAKAATAVESDEQLISAVSDRIALEAEAAPTLCPIMDAILARVSAPWLQWLTSELGFFSPAPGAAHKLSDHPIESLPMTFIDSLEQEIIDETRSTITMLHNQCPSHPLLAEDKAAVQTPFTCFNEPTISVGRVTEVAKQHEQSVLLRLGSADTIDIKQFSHKDCIANDYECDAWKDETSQRAYLEDLDTLITSCPGIQATSHRDDLQQQVHNLCKDQRLVCTEDGPGVSISLHRSPLDRVWPLIKTQHRLANGFLLRQVLCDHNLKAHLELQRAFHMFGNGTFVARLSTALFSMDVQSAERRRGKTPTGEIMGLRLGTTHEERWPPASSELRLTLMGILAEAYKTAHNLPSHTRSTDQIQLPGSLSFAIRELPEHEIDRVLDPNSIYALDFLRLQYIATAPLTAILTPNALEKYDDVFRFLLRLMRIVHVTAEPPQKHIAQEKHKISFANETHHFIAILMAHVMDIGIDAPWRDFATSLRDLQLSIELEDSWHEIGTKATMGIEGLRQLHDGCLERIRGRLFLKKKQQKLRTAIEDVLTMLLKSAFALREDIEHGSPKFMESHRGFRAAVSRVCALLQEQVDRSPRIIAAAEAEETEMSRLLLSKLNWNEYYK